MKNETKEQRKEVCQTKHICITECYWHLFDLPFVESSFTSVCLHTIEMESRPGVRLRQSKKLSFS